MSTREPPVSHMPLQEAMEEFPQKLALSKKMMQDTDSPSAAAVPVAKLARNPANILGYVIRRKLANEKAVAADFTHPSTKAEYMHVTGPGYPGGTATAFRPKRWNTGNMGPEPELVKTSRFMPDWDGILAPLDDGEVAPATCPRRFLGKSMFLLLNKNYQPALAAESSRDQPALSPVTHKWDPYHPMTLSAENVPSNFDYLTMALSDARCVTFSTAQGLYQAIRYVGAIGSGANKPYQLGTYATAEICLETMCFYRLRGSPVLVASVGAGTDDALPDNVVAGITMLDVLGRRASGRCAAAIKMLSDLRKENELARSRTWAHCTGYVPDTEISPEALVAVYKKEKTGSWLRAMREPAATRAFLLDDSKSGMMSLNYPAGMGLALAYETAAQYKERCPSTTNDRGVEVVDYKTNETDIALRYLLKYSKKEVPEVEVPRGKGKKGRQPVRFDPEVPGEEDAGVLTRHPLVRAHRPITNKTHWQCVLRTLEPEEYIDECLPVVAKPLLGCEMLSLEEMKGRAAARGNYLVSKHYATYCETGEDDVDMEDKESEVVKVALKASIDKGFSKALSLVVAEEEGVWVHKIVGKVKMEEASVLQQVADVLGDKYKDKEMRAVVVNCLSLLGHVVGAVGPGHIQAARSAGKRLGDMLNSDSVLVMDKDAAWKALSGAVENDRKTHVVKVRLHFITG